MSPSGGMQLSDDIAALLNSKIHDLEKGTKEQSEKQQRLQKNKAKTAAKTKLKEAKSLFSTTEVPNVDKIERLHKALQSEHDEYLLIAAETGNALGACVHEAEAELENTKAELSRTLAVNTKFEKLCRTLQQEAGKLVDARKDLTEKERQQRQDLANGFQCTIADLKQKIDQQATERFNLAQENEDLRNRFKQLFEQYDRSEKELAEHQKLQTGADKEFQDRFAGAYHAARQEMAREQAAQKFNEELNASEKELRDQLATYTEKLGQFQGSLSKSDKVLAKYKQHKSKSQRRVELLEKENRELRMRNEKKVGAALKERDSTMKEKEKLQERCTALQSERKRLLEAKGAK